MIGNARKINGLYYFDANAFNNRKANDLNSVNSLPTYGLIML